MPDGYVPELWHEVDRLDHLGLRMALMWLAMDDDDSTRRADHAALRRALTGTRKIRAEMDRLAEGSGAAQSGSEQPAPGTAD